jgi:surface antigen
MPWVDFETSGGKVLGASTVAPMAAPAVMFASVDVPLENYRPRDISKMSWADRFDYADEPPKQIKELEEAQQELNDMIDGCDQEIADIDEQIADLQAQRDALQKEADRLWNKIRPDDDGLRFGRDDGFFDMPWRTEADDLEDQIADLDRRIENLQEQKQGLIEQRQTHQRKLNDINQQLKALRQNQKKLNKLIDRGIPPDGPTKPDSLRNKLSGCTHYVAEKRDVSAWPDSKNEPGHPGNACQWDDQARRANYEVGQKPLKGAIVVWEPGAKYTQEHNNYTVSTHATAGHVAIVEAVDRSKPDVIRIKIGHANISQGSGTHSEPLHQWVTLDPAEVSRGDISFVYDKLPESSINTA